jgi:hypothetical protein
VKYEHVILCTYCIYFPMTPPTPLHITYTYNLKCNQLMTRNCITCYSQSEFYCDNLKCIHNGHSQYMYYVCICLCLLCAHIHLHHVLQLYHIMDSWIMDNVHACTYICNLRTYVYAWPAREKKTSACNQKQDKILKYSYQYHKITQPKVEACTIGTFW